MLKKLIFILLIALGSTSFSQFNTLGNTSQTGCNCFEVTPNSTTQSGSFNNTTDVDLTSNFSLLFNVNFGCDNFGGEGMAFVFQASGWSLGGPNPWSLGFEGIGANTMAVEFDTRDNQTPGQVANWDIGADHVAIQKNGSITHNPASPDMLVSPVSISATSSNVEDCANHLIQFDWTAGASQTLVVTVDGIVRITYNDDMITNVFGGDNMVQWGWSGSTGVFTNQQTVCTALVPDFTYSATNCPGQLINFTDASNSYYPIVNYSWDFDGLGTSAIQNPSFTFATAGNHPVTLSITDDQGCTEDTIIDIGVGFQVDVTADDAIICPNASTTLHVQGTPFVGNTCCFQLHCYDIWDDWNGAQVEIFVDGTSIGTYFNTNTGGGGATTDIFDLCFDNGQIIDLVINGTGTPQESSVYLVNAAGDTVAQIESDFITGTTSWFDGATTSYTVDCGITPPSYTYLWDNAGLLSPNQFDQDPTATVPGPTWFHVDVTDPGTGCVIVDSVFVDTYAPSDAVISGNFTICEGATADLTITFTGPGPYVVDVTGPLGPLSQINTSTSPYTLTVSDEGSYIITALTGAGCVGTFSGTGVIDTITPPTVTIGTDAQYCDGDPMIDLTVLTGGTGTVNWYSDPALTTLIGTGTTLTPTAVIGTTTYYAAETEGILGCQGPEDNVTITINPVPPAPTWSGQTTFCEGDTPIPLDAFSSLGGTITWYDAPPPAFVLSSLDSYSPALNVPGVSLWITETANGCEGPSTQIDVLVKPTPLPPAVTGTLQYCEGDVATDLTATQGMAGTIDWENSSGTNLATGTTFVPPLTVGSTDYNVFETLDGCTSDATTVTVIVDPAPEVDVPDQVEICWGDSIQVTATNNGYDITWNDGQSGPTAWFDPDTTTTYVVTATNPACGIAQDSVQVIVHSLPIVIAGNDTIIGIGGEVTMFVWTNVTTTNVWIPEPTECLNDDCSNVYDVPDQATAYVVIGTDENGCVNSDTVLIDISGVMEVFIPNIFSPNGDGSNDYLVVLGPRLFNYQIQIYDRWGKLVFESTEQKDYWDGKFEGDYLAPQTFVYMLSGETVLGDKIVREGNVSIIK